MNKEWAAKRLTAYLTALKRYEFLLDGDGYSQDAYENAIALEPAAKAIMKRVHPEYEEYSLIHSAHTQAITLTIQSLALLKDAEEIEKNLASPAPQLSADQLHPWVWEAAQSLWETKHYRAATQAAATNINAHLQDIVGRRDKSDYKLVMDTFSENAPEADRPRLRWPGNETDEDYKSMQSGIRNFGSGIFQAIRNPISHTSDELSEQEALERLAAMSLFCHWVEKCELTEKRRPTIGIRKLSAEEKADLN